MTAEMSEDGRVHCRMHAMALFVVPLTMQHCIIDPLYMVVADQSVCVSVFSA